MKIIVSACLLGYNVKYDGSNNFQEKLTEFLKDFEVIPVCPEVLGGLKIPRNPSEIVNNKVLTKKGKDVTDKFTIGAIKTLEIAKEHNIKYAILKENSPSCGSSNVYDGTFSHNIIPGLGITAKLLKENGIIILNEKNYQENIKKVLHF